MAVEQINTELVATFEDNPTPEERRMEQINLLRMRFGFSKRKSTSKNKPVKSKKKKK